MKQLIAILVTSLGVIACKTPATGSAELRRSELPATNPLMTALPVTDYDLAAVKAHFNNIMGDELKDKQLWAMFLREPDADTACKGMAIETYYFADKKDNNIAGYPVITAKPMPMNGPCGFLINSELKQFNDIGGELMESTPMGEIGTFDKIRISVKQAIITSQRKYKNFKYKNGVKIYRHLHPAMWNFPWYAIYGEACGLGATVIMNATTGEFVANMESPPAECPRI